MHKEPTCSKEALRELIENQQEKLLRAIARANDDLKNPAVLRESRKLDRLVIKTHQ